MERKFKAGDKVEANGNKHGRVIGYPYNDSNIIEVRLWDGFRHVGDIAIDDKDVIAVAS